MSIPESRIIRWESENPDQLPSVEEFKAEAIKRFGADVVLEALFLCMEGGWCYFFDPDSGRLELSCNMPLILWREKTREDIVKDYAFERDISEMSPQDMERSREEERSELLRWDELERLRRGDSASPATHSADFTSVNWFGTRYTFTKGRQAASVRALWEAWEEGGHGLTQETLKECAESSADRFELAKVFRNKSANGKSEQHPAWGTMIQSESKGVYRLVQPDSAQ